MMAAFDPPRQKANGEDLTGWELPHEASSLFLHPDGRMRYLSLKSNKFPLNFSLQVDGISDERLFIGGNNKREEDWQTTGITVLKWVIQNF